MIELILHTNRVSVPVPVPERWDELTGEQLLAVAGVLFSEEDPHQRDIQLACIICWLKPKQLQRFDMAVLVEQLLPLAEFITTTCDLRRQLLPDLIKRWYGPLDDLSNIRFVEFDAAERALHRWHQDVDDLGLLWRFVAVLYRPRKTGYDHKLNPDGDVRAPLNGNLTGCIAAEMQQRLTPHFAYAVLLWYKGCRQFITESFAQIFDAGDANQSDMPDEPAYFGLMRSIAKEGIYGTFAEVEQLYLYTALTEMAEALDERARLEEAHEEAIRNARNQ